MDNEQTAINSTNRTEKWTDRYRQNVEKKMQDKFFVVQRVWMKLSGSRQVTTLHHHALQFL
jgi:hypothetical protein